jgi:hypothetical protein
MVVDTNSGFGYIAHEVGHMLNLRHTFDQSNIKYDPDHKPGEYGHRYCIMSAQSYGRTRRQWTPDANAPSALRQVGPCLNGWDASNAGLPSWIPNQVTWRPGVDADLAIELESLGSWPGALTKVVRVQSAGNEFAIEYRNNHDYYDAGLPSSVVVISHGTGGRGRAVGGGATFVGEIRLPMILGRQGPTVYNNSGHGFGIEVLDWKQSSVLLRIFKGTATSVGVWPTVTIETGEVNKLPMGTFDYTNAGVYCVTGVWKVIRVLRLQIATIEWQVPPWPQTFVTRWWVGGQELTELMGKINVETEVDSPFPLPNGVQGRRETVELWFSINGSNQLKLSNLQPEKGNFSVDVRCLASFTVATLDRTEEVSFEGELLEHDPEDEFNEAFYTCWFIEKEKKERLPSQPHHKFEIPEPFQPQPPEESRHFSRSDKLDDPPEEPRHLSRSELLDVFERLPENPLNASVHRQLFRKITGVAPQRVRMVEASAVSAEMPRAATPCSSGPGQDLKSSD